jgi:hypothetical protein
VYWVRTGWLVLAVLATLYAAACVIVAGFETAALSDEPFRGPDAWRHALAAVLVVITVAILDMSVIVGLMRASKALLLSSWWWLIAALILGLIAIAG